VGFQRGLSVRRSSRRKGPRDYRTRRSEDVLHETLASLSAGAIGFSLGGGPNRPHPALLNLNLFAAIENVDICGDAHCLPVADKSVDIIFAEAVFEHLHDPHVAVLECARVLKPGGRILSITPFLQAFHGYPSHYTGWTLPGHEGLFTRAGFRVLESGTACGPFVMLTDLVYNLILRYSPRGIGAAAWRFATTPIRALDNWAAELPQSAGLASTTFVLAENPIP
jgi:SAM-dependent methyltransferase